MLGTGNFPVFSGKIRFPGNGIREHRPLLCSLQWFYSGHSSFTHSSSCWAEVLSPIKCWRLLNKYNLEREASANHSSHGPVKKCTIKISGPIVWCKLLWRWPELCKPWPVLAPLKTRNYSETKWMQPLLTEMWAQFNKTNLLVFTIVVCRPVDKPKLQLMLAYYLGEAKLKCGRSELLR